MSSTDIFQSIQRATPALALTPYEEATLAIRAKGGHRPSQQQLLANYIPALAKEVKAALGGRRDASDYRTYRADADDIRAAAIEGFYDALKAFDPTKHRRLAATIERSVRSHVTKALVEYLPVRIPETAGKIYSKALRLSADDLSKAREIAPSLGMPVETFDQVDRVFAASAMVAPEDADDADEQPRRSRAAVSLEQGRPTIRIEDLHDAERALSALSPKERVVIEVLYGIGDNAPLSERDAAKALGIPRTSLQRVHAAALLSMRTTLGA